MPMVSMDAIEVSEFPIFQDVAPTIARQFIATGQSVHYEACSEIIASQDSGEQFFIVLEGVAKLVLANPQGDGVNITLFCQGDFFGELAMLDAQPTRNANIIAVTDVELVAIQKTDFLNLMDQFPRLALNIARVVSQRLSAMNERLVTERMSDDKRKVAQTLLSLAPKGQPYIDEGSVMLPPLSLREWALFCCTTTENFINSIQLLKEAAVLDWHQQRIVIRDPVKMKELVDMLPPAHGDYIFIK